MPDLMTGDHALNERQRRDKPAETEDETSRRMDPELRTLGLLLRELDRLEPAASRRVMAYLASRYGGEA